MLLLILGGLLIGVATIMDSIFRMRMVRAGHRWAMLRGGAFNYAEYHKTRKEHGWPAWPVYVMWILVTCGLALLMTGFFVKFGTHPH